MEELQTVMADLQRPLRLEDIPAMNFGKYLLDRMKRFRDQDAVVDGTTRKSYSYHDVISRSERLAAGLQRFGVQPGDVICMFTPNHIDYLTVFYSSTLINAVLQAINPLFTTDDLKKVLTDCNTKFIVTIPALVPKVTEATRGLKTTKVIVFGTSDGCTSFDSLLAAEGTPYRTPEADWKSKTAVLLYSSGTTGFPKAVKQTHYSLTANAIQMNRSGINFSGQCLISFLPLFHIYGLVVMGSTVHCMGCKLVIMARFDLEEYLSLIQTFKPPTLQLVPPVMVLLAKHPRVSEYDLSSVKRILCGAAPLSAEIEDAVLKRLKLEDIQQGYGMTEVGVTHINTVEESRRNAVGKLLELTEMKIVDVETGKLLGVNEAGEVLIRGPQVSTGYRNLPAQTREMFIEDGWVRTGDIGKQDKDGYLFIVDRLKELIKYKGFQVAPATLEDILLRHDAVADAGVIGVPDEEAGELPRAFVVRKPGKEVTEQTLQDFVAGLVAPYMKLRGGVEFTDEIPRSLSGKILRRVLRETAKTTRSKL